MTKLSDDTVRLIESYAEASELVGRAASVSEKEFNHALLEAGQSKRAIVAHLEQLLESK